jgi:1-deoxyxylulose-5-phosphate synthase
VAQLAVAWLVAQPVVASVIIGATKPAQARANAAAASWVLSADDVDEVAVIGRRS